MPVRRLLLAFNLSRLCHVFERFLDIVYLLDNTFYISSFNGNGAAASKRACIGRRHGTGRAARGMKQRRHCSSLQ